MFFTSSISGSYTNQPASPSSAVSFWAGLRTVTSPLVQFGFQKRKDDLPHWAENIPAPQYSMPDLWPLSEALRDNVEKLRHGHRSTAILKQIQRQTIDIFRLYLKIQNELRYKGIPYLPKDKREQVAKFRRSFRYLFLRFFLPRSTQRRLTVLQGPAAIKRAQEEYQLTEKLSNDLSLQIKNMKNIKGLSLTQRLKRFQIIAILRLLQLRMQWIISTNRPLGNRIPGLPKEKMRSQIEALLQVYNRQYKNDPIDFKDIRSKPIASGSMGQVFLGKTRSGKQMIIKIQRETPDQMEGYLPYIYFCKTVFVGTRERQLCVEESQKQLNTLKEEADGRTELRNANKMADYIRSRDLKGIRVSSPLVATEGGLIMPFVGEKDLAEISTAHQQQTIRKIAPALLQIQVCSPNKLADLYFSNLRLPMPAYLIDHGRAFSLVPSTHEKLLRLVTLALASPEPRNQLGEDPKVQQAIQDLLAGVNDTTTPAGKLAMSVRFHIPDAAQKFVDMLLSTNPLFLESSTLDPGKKVLENGIFPGNEPYVHLLSFWSNYLTFCTPDRGFPPLIESNKMLPAVLDLESAYTKFKSTIGVGFIQGSTDIDDKTLRERILQKAHIRKRITRGMLQQYRQMDALQETTVALGRAMIQESGLSGKLTREQQENLKRRLNIALYCDLVM